MSAADTVPATGQGASDALRAPLIAFAAMVALLALAHWGTLRGLVDIWYSTATYQHGFLVLPLSLWLVWQRRVEFATRAAASGGSALALLPLAASTALAFLGEIGGIALFAHAGLVGSLMALVPLVFGWAVARAFWFPILFLGFMVPAGDALIAPLQELTADVSVWMLQLTGIPVYREGLMIELPSGLWEVAEACAGLRFLIANLFVAAVFAYLSYMRVWKWALFLTLAVAIPVGANCLRAYGIMLIAHLTDNAVAAGVDHLVYGWVFFSAVMLAMLWIGGLFADRSIAEALEPEAACSDTLPVARLSLPVIAGALLLIVSAPAAAALTAPIPAPLPERIAERLVPSGWQVVPTDSEAPDRWAPRFDSADRLQLLRLADGTHTVDLMVAAYTHQREGAEALHWANRYDDDEIWKRAALGGLRLQTGASGLPSGARRDDLTYHVNDAVQGTLFKARIVASWVLVGDTLTASGKQAKLAEIETRLRSGDPRAAVIALSAEHPGAGREHEAIAAIEALLATMAPIDGLLNAERR